MNSIRNNAWATVLKKPQTNNIVNGIVKITSRSLRVVLLLKKDRVATVSHNSNIDTVTHGTEVSQRSLYVFLLNRYGDEWQSLRLFVCQARNSCLRSPWDLFNSSSCCIPFPTASRRHYCSLLSAQPSIGKGARSACFYFLSASMRWGRHGIYFGDTWIWVMGSPITSRVFKCLFGVGMK